MISNGKNILKQKGRARNRAGDTIVEVLMSIAIVSVVITGAYAISNRSLHQGISASEHTQALKLAEGQLEALKFRQQQSAAKDFLTKFDAGQGTSPSDYCLNINATGPADSNWGTIPNGNTTNLQTGSGHYNVTCLDSQYSKYYINIHAVCADTNSCPTSNQGAYQAVYHITVRWVAIGNNGGGEDQTQLYYKFPGSAPVVSQPPPPPFDPVDCKADLQNVLEGARVVQGADGGVVIQGPNGQAIFSSSSTIIQNSEGQFIASISGGQVTSLTCQTSRGINFNWNFRPPPGTGTYQGGGMNIVVTTNTVTCQGNNGQILFNRTTGQITLQQGSITPDQCGIPSL